MQNRNNMAAVLKSLRMLDSKTLEVRYHDNVQVGLPEIQDLMDDLYEFTENRPLKRLIICTEKSTMNREARAYLQNENKRHSETIIAEAVVVTSFTQKMSTNFYLSFMKNVFPSKFFTDEAKALEWLNQH